MSPLFVSLNSWTYGNLDFPKSILIPVSQSVPLWLSNRYNRDKPNPTKAVVPTTSGGFDDRFLFVDKLPHLLSTNATMERFNTCLPSLACFLINNEHRNKTTSRTPSLLTKGGVICQQHTFLMSLYLFVRNLIAFSPLLIGFCWIGVVFLPHSPI